MYNNKRGCADKIIFSGFNQRVNRLSVSLFETAHLLVSVSIGKHRPMSLFFFLSHNIQACHGVVYENNIKLLGSLSTRVFETRTATGKEYFACQDSGVSQIFIPIISKGEKILSNVNVVV